MKAWELRIEEKRTFDTLPTFIIFCEDEVSEPNYFRSFETVNIKVNTIGGQKSKSAHVYRAIHHCLGSDLLKEVNGEYKKNCDDIHLWCVFDRDKEKDRERDHIANIADIEFTEAIKTARNSGINVAWSNDSFELWILLHFEDVDASNHDAKNRIYYYARLTNIFSSIHTENDSLLKVRVIDNFDYKKHLKSEKSFTKVVLRETKPNTEIAIARARALAHFHEKGESKIDHEKSPCTMVYQLVEDLIRLGRG
jgi:hypothetical protein